MPRKNPVDAPAAAITPSTIETRIHLVRGLRVMLDSDLAELYGVETKVLNRAVARNAFRFPSDFAFLLTPEESGNLRFQIGTSSLHGGRRYLPRAFTEQGVAMLSSVLRSRRAVDVNIAIMRAFVYLRDLLTSHKALARRIDELEQRYDGNFAAVFDAIRELTSPTADEKGRTRIGFVTGSAAPVRDTRALKGRPKQRRRPSRLPTPQTQP